MSFNTKTYKQITRDILAQMSGGEVTEQQTFTKEKIVYKLANAPVTEIKSVEGTMKGKSSLFTKGAHYKFTENSLEWISEECPDDDTEFTIKCVVNRQTGISDVHPGSVARTLVESISREIEYFYLQMEQAYFSGFLDTASGNALDLVVSILGIKRKPPQPSSGFVTFGRNTEPEVLFITGEVYLYNGSLEYKLNKSLVKEIVKIEGASNGSPKTFVKNVDYTFTQKKIKWLPEGIKPDMQTVFKVDYTAFREIIISKGVNVTTFSLKPEEIRSFTTLEDTLLTSTFDGKWEVKVPIISTVPGRSSNVLAGTVVVMPQAVPGIEYVINEGDITNGVEAEQDSELRERAKHALEFAGKATYSSIESAIRSVEGVRSLVIEDMPDGVPGIVKIIVDGGRDGNIQTIINETRAAGIKVEFHRPQTVYVTVSLKLVLKKGAVESLAVAEAEKRIRSYISNLGIGDDVLYSRLVEIIVSVNGVWDVQDLKLTAYRSDGKIVESQQANLAISIEERAEPRNVNISFEVRK